MDNENVLSLSNNQVELDKDMNDWLSTLTYKQRKISDDECIKKYGCTNTDLYNGLSAILAKKTIPDDTEQIIRIVKEEFKISYDSAIFGDLSDESLYERLMTSRRLNNDVTVIIPDYSLKGVDDIGLDGVQKLYDRYLTLPSNYKNYSDTYNNQLWGRTVPQMYQYLVSYYQTKEYELNHNSVDDRVEKYSESLNTLKEKGDALNFSLLKLGCYEEQDTFYESSLLEDIADNYGSNVDDNIDYNQELPVVTPYFTPDEYKGITHKDILPFNYSMIDNPKKYLKVIHDLQNMLDGDQRELAEKKLLELGWNPWVKVTAESLKFARDKQVKWFNENEQVRVINLEYWDGGGAGYGYSPSPGMDVAIHQQQLQQQQMIQQMQNNAINITSKIKKPKALSAIEVKKLYSTQKLVPIYLAILDTSSIVATSIKAVKNTPWTHVCLSLDTGLHKMYTYSIHFDERKDNGFSYEDIDHDFPKNNKSKLNLVVMFIPEKAKKKIESVLKWFVANKGNTQYDIEDFYYFIVNKAKNSKNELAMVCSQFVDYVLRIANVNKDVGKPSNLILPADFVSYIDNKTVFSVYEGLISKYKKEPIDKKVSALIRNFGFNKKNRLNMKDTIKNIKTRIIESVSDIECIENGLVKDELDKIQDYLLPRPVIQEAILPFGFDDKGDFFLVLPKDLEQEYQASHRILRGYGNSNIEGMKHELAKLFYINYIIEKKLKRMDKDNKNYKPLINLRARVLNDFTTYFKIIKSADKNFNFAEYIETTEFSSNKLRIDRNTLKYSGEAIKAFAQLMSN